MATKSVKKALNDLLVPVDLTSVVTFDPKLKKLFIGGKMVDPATVQNLQSEADFFLASDLWKLINESIKESAQRALFVNGETMDDIKKGRAMLYMLDTQNNILKTIKASK